MNIFESAFGHYEVVGDQKDADVIVGHSFGTSIDDESVNRQIANFMLNIANGRPMVADRTLANAFPEFSVSLNKIVEGPVSNNVGVGVGTWGTLVEAKEFMSQNELLRPMMAAQTNHIGRVAMQSRKLEMNSVIPADLPTDFDTESDQIWTRSRALWIPREILGSIVLKAQGKL